ADGGRWPRRDLGRVERDSPRDGADGRGRRAERLRGRPRDPCANPAAHAGELRRVESRACESGDGGDGPARGSVPPADGAAEAGVEGEDRGRAERARPAEGNRGGALIVGARYVHTNLVARNWRGLAAFCQTLFGCIPVPPERDYSGPLFEAGTGVKGA